MRPSASDAVVASRLVALCVNNAPHICKCQSMFEISRGQSRCAPQSVNSELQNISSRKTLRTKRVSKGETKDARPGGVFRSRQFGVTTYSKSMKVLSRSKRRAGDTFMLQLVSRFCQLGRYHCLDLRFWQLRHRLSCPVPVLLEPLVDHSFCAQDELPAGLLANTSDLGPG